MTHSAQRAEHVRDLEAELRTVQGFVDCGEEPCAVVGGFCARHGNIHRRALEAEVARLNLTADDVRDDYREELSAFKMRAERAEAERLREQSRANDLDQRLIISEAHRERAEAAYCGGLAPGLIGTGEGISGCRRNPPCFVHSWAADMIQMKARLAEAERLLSEVVGADAWSEQTQAIIPRIRIFLSRSDPTGRETGAGQPRPRSVSRARSSSQTVSGRESSAVTVSTLVGSPRMVQYDLTGEYRDFSGGLGMNAREYTRKAKQ